MSSRQGFLVNNVAPSTVYGKGVDVAEGAVRITCTGLGLPGAAWQVRVGTAANGTWANVVRFGVPIVLSDNNTQYVEVVAGTYRVAPGSLPGAAQVWFQEDEITTSDARTTYIFGQENTNQNGITANSTASIAVSGNGTVAAPLGLAVKYSTDAANLAHTGTDGAVEATLETANTSSVTLVGTGVTATPLNATVNISTTAGNTLIQNSDGLFVPSSTPHNLSPTDALALATAYFNGCVGLSLTLGTPINISAITTPDTIYARAVFTNNVLVTATGTLETPATMPTQGSIGPTVTALVVGGAYDTTTSASLPGHSGVTSNGFIAITGTASENIVIQVQVVLTLQ